MSFSVQALMTVKRNIVEIEKFKKEISIKRNVPTKKISVKKRENKGFKKPEKSESIH